MILSEGLVQSPLNATTSGAESAAWISSRNNTLYLFALQVTHQSAVTSTNTRLLSANAWCIASSDNGCQFIVS